jgi:hypothetical protein
MGKGEELRNLPGFLSKGRGVKIMYTHVSKGKNNKIKFLKSKITFQREKRSGRHLCIIKVGQRA